jgi:adenylate kinase
VLENRSDDELETILKRYDTYMETTRPVLDYYSKNSNFHEIDGTQEIDEITRKIDTFINV